MIELPAEGQHRPVPVVPVVVVPVVVVARSATYQSATAVSPSRLIVRGSMPGVRRST